MGLDILNSFKLHIFKPILLNPWFEQVLPMGFVGPWVLYFNIENKILINKECNTKLKNIKYKCFLYG